MNNNLASAAAAALVLGALALPARALPPAQKTYASPAAALEDLRAAVAIRDREALRAIFGPGAQDLLSGDPARDEKEFQRFTRAMAEGAKAVPDNDLKVTLEIGRNKWPFPVPLVKEGPTWRFDTDAGKEAIIDRRIGRGELHAIAACRAFALGDGKAPKASRGYLYKLLAGKAAGETALVAYPEEWGRSGVMTFIVDRDGRVFQRDLGERTLLLAAEMAAYKPDGDWTLVIDRGVIEK